MEQATTIGLDIAKHVLQVHGADSAGHVLFRKRITRVKLLGFLAAQAPCVVAMEACAGAHYWAREIAKLGHHVRLIAPATSSRSSGGKRTMPPMQRPSVKRPSGRACASFRSRVKSNRRTASCFELVISWCGSAPSASTLFAGTLWNTATSFRRALPMLMTASDHAQQRPQRFPLPERGRPQMGSGHPHLFFCAS